MTYRITTQAVRQAVACGVRAESPDAVARRLQTMLRSAVRCKTVTGNLSLGPYLFRVQGETLLTVDLRGPRESLPAKETPCSLCDGTLIRVSDSRINGEQTRVARPCPRALDPALPKCDSVRKGG